MYAFKYVASVSAAISVLILGAIFLGSAATTLDTSAPQTPSWKIERFRTDPDVPYVAQGSLSPIYPATPGKELLGKPIVLQVHAKHAPVNGKAQSKTASAIPIHVRQARATPLRLPPQIYSVTQDQTYQQRLGYADDQPRRALIFGHSLY
jgi:hypothetical protein